MFSCKYQKNQSLIFKSLIVLCTMLLPLSILSLLLSLNTMRSLKYSTEDSLTSSISAYSSQIEQKLRTSDYILATLFDSNDTFLKLLNGSDDWHDILYQHQITHAMNLALVNSNSCDALFLYIPDQDNLILSDRFRFVDGVVVGHLSKDTILGLMDTSEYTNGKWNLYEDEGTQYLVRINDLVDYTIGTYINLTASLSVIQSGLSHYDALPSFSETLPENGHGYQYFSAQISPSNVYLCAEIPFLSTYRSVFFWILASLLLFIFSLLVVPVISLSFRRNINRPLEDLRKAFHELENGNEDYRITVKATSREFNETFSSFNKMAETTAMLRQQTLEEERNRHEMTENILTLQLENLQLQIRPHFLQNTMNLLFTLIQNHQEENAQRLVLYLSKYFRYMFIYNHDLELFDKEIDLIREYLTISAFRNQEAFTVSYQLDPMLSFLRVPPLLLHNFVENIIKHALIPGQVIHIILYGEYDDDQKMAIIQISDDGRGISEEYVHRINTNDFDDFPPGQHVGIRNSIRRLDYYFHGEASIQASTSDAGGTIITIKIPCNFSEETEDETNE